MLPIHEGYPGKSIELIVVYTAQAVAVDVCAMGKKLTVMAKEFPAEIVEGWTRLIDHIVHWHILLGYLFATCEADILHSATSLIDSSDSYPSSAHRAIMSSPPLRLSVDGEAVTLVGSKKRRRIFPTPRLDVAFMLDARIQYSIIIFMTIIIVSYRSETRFLLIMDSAGFLSPQKN